MNIDELLKQINKSRTKKAEGETESQIPQELPTEPATELPKNVVTEGQAGDEQKVMELLEAIEQGGEVGGAAESIMTAKIAEEMAALDQVIIEKQAEHFGVKMADAFARRLIEINNPPISEKQAAEMVKAASEEEYARWFNAGAALWDGYVTKAAEFGTDGGAGIIDNGGQPVPAAFNQSEVDAFADDLAGYLASEFGGEGDDDKSASEKQAGKAEIFNKIKGFLSGAGGKLKSVGVVTKAHPFRAGAITAGVGAAAYGGSKLKDALYGKNRPNLYDMTIGHKRASSDADAILNAFTTGVINKKEAAEKLLALKK